MALTGLVESAVGIERHAQRRGSRQSILGAIDGEHRQALPGVLFGRRPPRIGQPDRSVVPLFKRGPRQLRSGFGHGAAVDGFGLGPQAAATGVAKEGAGFAVHALAFAAGGQEQQEQKELGERELAPARKGLRRSGEGVRKTVRN
jgi:hypothetical protein